MGFVVAIFLCFYLFALSIGLVFKVLTTLFIRNPDYLFKHLFLHYIYLTPSERQQTLWWSETGGEAGALTHQRGCS